MGYSYYDTPDGRDCFHKTWYLVKRGAMAGGVLALYDVLLYSHPQGYYQTAARVAHWVGPMAAAAGTFAAITCASTSMRNKDDGWNYFFGGCAAAGVLGTWRRSIMVGFLGSIVLGTAGVIKKYQKVEGWQFYKVTKAREYSTVFVNEHDWTLTKERPRNWTTQKQ